MEMFSREHSETTFATKVSTTIKTEMYIKGFGKMISSKGQEDWPSILDNSMKDNSISEQSMALATIVGQLGIHTRDTSTETKGKVSDTTGGRKEASTKVSGKAIEWTGLEDWSNRESI